MDYTERRGDLPPELIRFLLAPGGHSLVIKGEAGTGKTTLALQLIEMMADKGNQYYLSSRVSDESLYRILTLSSMPNGFSGGFSIFDPMADIKG